MKKNSREEDNKIEKTEEKQKLAVVYNRFGEREQMKDTDLKELEIICKEYCMRYGLEIVQTFSDVGIETNGINKLIEFCMRNKQIKYLIGTDYDRLATNKSYGAWLKGKLEEFGVLYMKVISVPSKKEKRLKTAVIYARTASTMQKFDNNISSQVQLCKDYCKKSGLRVRKIFSDSGKSGNDINREGIKELLDYAKRNKYKVSYLVVHRFDRLSRSLEDHLWFRKELIKLGITVKSVTETNFVDDSTDRLQKNILGALNKYDSKLMSERVKRGMREKKLLVEKNKITNNFHEEITAAFSKYNTGTLALNVKRAMAKKEQAGIPIFKNSSNE
jgi:DNA invertase Pin-like site-specific DNA recombinase